MPETRQLVINTGPIISLVAATGDLKLLDSLYDRVVVPFEVGEEILVSNATRFAAAEKEDSPDPITLCDIHDLCSILQCQHHELPLCLLHYR